MGDRMNFLKKALNWYLAWESARLLRRSLQLDDSVCRGFIMERANELALAGVLAFLEREGLSHCAKCPTRGPLIRMLDKYWCQKHVPIIKPEEALKNGGLSHAHA
ncbi:hypothetical protein KW797_02555 [Candidatus Parcubacteria bacterium]|nr:hypothetical protein [Candidatus Parcubacteria bacterium]